MADPHEKHPSPISQVLQSLGLTREDLLRHSDQMRQFLTAEDANSLRVLTRELSEPGSTLFGSTRTQSLSRSNSVANAPTNKDSPAPQQRQLTSPATPVKAEPVESPVPQRHMDSMEMVIERKSRQNKRDRKGRRERERNNVPPSPSPSSAGFSLDSFMQSRDGRRVSMPEPSEAMKADPPEQTTLAVPPVTPQPRKYYKDHVVNDTTGTGSRQDVFSVNPDSPTPARYRTRNTPARNQPTTFVISETPKRTNNYYKSPLPASSPPLQSSPFSSPVKRVVNLVSSPGPMGPPPSESEYGELPYVLPPGPYSSKKPDLSYAALVGRAILSSPKHALTLQEIYDWITIVYPHFKRGETTWMNSIRHVLSTTACFRKHTRERSVGRTLWAIWDCDLECFKNGGFRKQYCKDLVDSRKAAALVRKRSADESGDRKPKRQKKSAAAAAAEKDAAEALSAANSEPTLPPLVPASQLNPLFPATRPTPHHQSYYESCIQQQDAMSAEVIFPPLPQSNFQRMASGASTSSASTSYSRFSFVSEPSFATTYDSEPPSNSPPAPSSSASASVPGLTPDGSSSSPPLPSEDNMDDTGRESPDLVYPGDADDKLFSEMLSAEALEPGFTLNKHDYYESINHGKKKPVTPAKKSIALPPVAPSPTLNRKSNVKATKNTTSSPQATNSHLPMIPSVTTPPLRPTTPPRSAAAMQYLQLSAVRTPLSHKGLHMSPSASLVHYKSHLDPPPPAVSSTFSLSSTDTSIPSSLTDSENIRTPSRKRASHLNSAHNTLFPVTPQKLVFYAPNSGNSQDSPFRTPGSRQSIFDPHDPGALLDEELSRLGAQMGAQDSPAGVYEGKRGLLYESPNVPSPGKWAKWW